MNYSMIRYVLFSVLCIEGALLLVPAGVGLLYGEKEFLIYLAVSLAAVGVGLIGRIKKPKSTVMYSREGLISVALSWILMSVVGAVPMYFAGGFNTYIDAFFETVSGFTTTGASILTDVESLCRSTAFFRCFSHWIGGMGVLVFIMAIMPSQGGSEIHLMRAESPGPSVGKLVPKVKSTAMILYGIYIGITALQIISLLISGMSVFDSFALSFATAGTGGFGTLNSSISSYTAAQQIIITVFMFAFAINFGLYYLVLIKRPKEALFDEELRWFAVISLVASAIFTLSIYKDYPSFGDALRVAFFQVGSLISTTGFSTADFNLWSPLCHAVVVFLMFLGATAGSTGGGYKVSRLMISLKAAKNEVISVAHPHSVQKVRINKRQVNETVVHTVLCYTVIYFAVIFVSFLIISFDGFDITTNFTAVLSAFNNIGPGLGKVGPTGSFADYSIISKIILSLDMLIGRLEIFPIIVLFVPEMWKHSRKKI